MIPERISATTGPDIAEELATHRRWLDVSERSVFDQPPPRTLPSPLSVVVVASEDQVTFRRMLAALDVGGIEWIATQEGEEESAASAAAAPVIALSCDIAQPQRIAGLRRLRARARRRRIVVVSPAANGPAVRRALEAGADGVVFESQLEQALSAATRATAAGQATLPRELHACTERPAFSHRERQVLGSVAEGLTNNEIAARLFLSESTVKSHLSSAFAKLGVRSRKDAAALVLDPDQDLGVCLAAAGGASPLSDAHLRATA